jgi:hypothetical protein
MAGSLLSAIVGLGLLRFGPERSVAEYVPDDPKGGAS